MILDGFALQSLHLLPSNDVLSRAKTDAASLDKDGQKFSLFNTIDLCLTAFGRRKLHQWVCAPVCDPIVLKKRQEAIAYLCKLDTKPLLEKASEFLKGVPDLERMFSRIHNLGSKHRREKHPDSRAQFFDATRSSRQIRDFCATLSGVERINDLLAYFEENNSNDEDW